MFAKKKLRELAVGKTSSGLNLGDRNPGGKQSLSKSWNVTTFCVRGG